MYQKQNEFRVENTTRKHEKGDHPNDEETTRTNRPILSGQDLAENSAIHANLEAASRGLRRTTRHCGCPMVKLWSLGHGMSTRCWGWGGCTSLGCGEAMYQQGRLCTLLPFHPPKIWRLQWQAKERSRCYTHHTTAGFTCNDFGRTSWRTSSITAVLQQIDWEGTA